ncbi:MAG: hypothetical protein HQ472_08040 [Ignavibacteria bacterium]|nr:hypothetical protein [Ignavibacteria bacterium]
MRKFCTSVLLVLVIACANAVCQRPWEFTFPHNTGPTTKVARTSNTLYLFSNSTLSSYNHGILWDTVLTLPGSIRGITEVLNTVTITVAQPDPTAPFIGYYTQSGTVWTPFDTIPSEGKMATCVTSYKNDYYIGTDSPVIYKRGDATTKISVSTDQFTKIKQLIITDEFMMVLLQGGLLKVSTNSGAEWQDAMNGIPPTAMPNPAVLVLELIEGKAYVGTVKGVMTFSVSKNMWEDHGAWTDMAVLPIAEVAGDGRRLIAFAIQDEQFQMYRLEANDSVWIETAYPLPGKAAPNTTLNCVMDGGWAVAYYIPSTIADSAGVYVYNLDDFTSVSEEKAGVASLRVENNNLVVHTATQGEGVVVVVDILGRKIIENNVVSVADFALPLSPTSTGVLGLIILPKTGAPIRMIFNR